MFSESVLNEPAESSPDLLAQVSPERGILGTFSQISVKNMDVIPGATRDPCVGGHGLRVGDRL